MLFNVHITEIIKLYLNEKEYMKYNEKQIKNNDKLPYLGILVFLLTYP